MYWLWKWLESYNHSTFSTWKDKFVFNLLIWTPISFCTFHDYGRRTPFLASPDGRHWFFIIQISEQHSCPEKQSCHETFHCVEIFFIFQNFWATCTCPEKQSVPWIHCIEYTYIFNHSEFWTTCACPEKQSLPWNCSLHWNMFHLSGFLRNLRLPWKQSLSWTFSLYLIHFSHSGCLSNFCLPWKTECDLNSQLWTCIFYHSEFWTIWTCPEKRVCPEFFKPGGGRPLRLPGSYATVLYACVSLH